ISCNSIRLQKGYLQINMRQSSKFRDIQFEWAWQHPVESLPVRKAAAKFKSLSGVANKIKLAYIILTYHLGR
ncbi:hypothetical protein S245_036913, partial [Arachis hypogaea]